MGVIRDAANITFADGPSSSPHEPRKDGLTGIRALFGTVEDAVGPAMDYLGYGALGPNLLIRSPIAGTTRAHVEPNGNVQSGTASKFDMMGAPYNDNQADYWIQSMFTTVGDPEARGIPMRANWNMKAVGDWFGGPLEQSFGFSDFGISQVPMKMYQIDFADPIYRAPHKGAWRPGLVVTAGDYVTHETSTPGIYATYQAAGGGTVGATPPTHTAGSVSDGVVTWDWIYTHNSFNIRPVVVFGERDDMPVLGVSLQNDRVQFHQNYLLKNGVAQRFLNASGDAVIALISALAGDRLRIAAGDGSVGRDIDQAGKWQRDFGGFATTHTIVNDGLATVSVAGRRDIILQPAGALNVTAFSGGISRQEFYLESTRSDTTITAGAGILLNGLATLNMRQNTPYLFKYNTSANQAKLVASTGT